MTLTIYIKCPHCKNPVSRVKDKRVKDYIIRRRRECMVCGTRFTTYEFMIDKKTQLKDKLEKVTELEKEVEKLKQELALEVHRKTIEEEEQKKENGEDYINRMERV